MFNLKNKKFRKHLSRTNLFTVFFLLFIFAIFTKANAASLIFSPSVGNFYVGDTFTVSVLVDSQGVAINSVDTSLNFPTDYLSVISVDSKDSIFSVWIKTPTYSNDTGVISFTGGLPTPGFNGSGGKIIEITFRAKKEGIAKINYFSGSVHANDGLGTNVLQNTGEGEYTIGINPPKEVVPIVVSKPIVPEISSVNFPDPEKWYSDRNPQFSWTYPNAFSAVKISYDNNAEASPVTTYATTSTEIQYNNASDGVHYLHLQVKDKNGWSNIANYKFQIDTERPQNFTITELDKNNTEKTQTEFTFDATDVLSGLDHFEISVDGSVPETLSGSANQYYKTSVLEPGRHIIVIEAYDKAGNLISSSDVFSIYASTLVSTTTQEAISNVTKKITTTFSDTGKTITKLVGEANKIVNSPIGSAVTKTISTTGLIISSSIITFIALAPASMSDLWLIFARFIGLLLGVIGLRKKNRPWGTVYDSMTKRPLDPVYVSLIDLETGKEVANAITDLDGRYGFLVVPGRYGIEVTKTNYASPSLKMKGKTFDEVYNDLYFGSEIIIEKEGEVIAKNIPMDPMKFDWNEFAKKRMNVNTFIKDKDIVWARISKILFNVGAVISVIALVFTPVPYNFIVAGFYVLAYIFNFIVFNRQKPGVLTERQNSLPLSYAIVKIYREGEETPITKKITDKFGKYYVLVPNGKYYLTIDKKNDDESYTEILHTADIDVENGIINFDINV